MKIGMVCPYDVEAFGGVQTHIRELAEALTARGHEVLVLSPRNLGRSQRIRFSGTSFEISWMSWSDWRRARAFLKREKFDVLHFHTPWSPFFTFQLLAISRIPKVATFHDVAPDTLLGRLLSQTVMPVCAFLLNKFVLTRSIAVSDGPMAYLNKFVKSSAVVIPNGVNLSSYSSSTPGEDPIDSCLTILFLGRLEKRKGVQSLLKAYKRVKQEVPQVRLLLAGDGYLQNSLRRWVEAHQIEDVTFLGSVDENRKRRLMSDCDIFCSPALYGESFGIVLLEAMASGKPALGAANPGYREVLKARANSLLFPPGNSDVLGDKLINLLKNDELRSELGLWGREEAQRYDWPNLVHQVENVYQSALELHG